MAQPRHSADIPLAARPRYTLIMSFPTRRLVAAAVTLPLIAAGLAVLPAAASAARTPAPTATPATHTVTLITGDVVTIQTLAGGQQIADVKRPDNATGGVRVESGGGDLYVLPDEAVPLVNADRLDRRLFNVTDLVEMGYDDAKAGGIPLIATGTLPSATVVRRLPSIGASAVRVDKKQARTFWSASVARAAGKLWLDGRVRANLKESVPQVGAPQAWAAGYDGTGVTVAVLDTGVDAGHPDLAGKVDEAVSFVPGDDAGDANGHGTHVASTVAGTGAASGGVYKGVAPGADLVVGKVLDDSGFGNDSWVLAGMEWAAGTGADVVSMSLGDDTPSDGTDPLSAAVDALSAQYGTLFVIAAGNAGPETIGAPGSAASALTVGAVDKSDALADFSSTGPLIGTGGLKPDLTAPGVDITAARAQEGGYTTLSGTSMATPHVSGAAAILAQRHPDWTGERLKAALMSSAKGLAGHYSGYEVGTGRLDVAAAVSNTVQATGSAFFGNYDFPHEPGDAPVTKPVTFTNSGKTPVTLNLAVTGGPFTVGSPSVTVPAGGSADVQVTGDPTVDGVGRFTGWLTGTDAATGTPLTRTTLGLLKEDERYDLTIRVRDRAGKPANVWVVLSEAGEPAAYRVEGETTLRLRPGTYAASSYLDVPGERPDALGLAVLVASGVKLDRSRTITLDARRARLLQTTAPRRTEDRQRKIDFNAGGYRSGYQVPVKYDDLYVSPGSYDLVTRWRKGEPALSLNGGGRAFDAVVQPGSTFTAGSATLRSVYAGTGAASEYAGRPAAGRIAVVTRSDAVSAEERAAAAVAAGAKALIVVNDGIGVLNEWVGEAPIPVATVHRDQGARLVSLARSGAQLGLTRTPCAGYVYDLARNYAGQVPDRPLTYRPSHDNLARIDAHYYAVRPAEGAGFRYDMTFTPSVGFREREWHPGTRTEWVTPGQEWFETHQQGSWSDSSYRNTYRAGTTTRLNWFAPATRPAFSRAFAVQNGRYRDYLTINVKTWSPSGVPLEHGGDIDWGEVPTNLKLYQGDKLIDENPNYSDLQWTEVPSGTLPYRLVLDASRPAEQWRLSTRTHTEWRFVSGSNEADDFVPLALLQLDYDVPTDLHGDVRAGATQRIGLTAGPQPGGTGTGRVTTVTLDVSYDDGATWLPVSLRKDSDGHWSGTFKPSKKAGFVSVRASAATKTGWRIDQEIIRAYGVR
ncbi:peptidase [Phytohabitans aurantiacus]|uniref:Peptidase n=2 Tax=Phytohabitans aurantiacus TaxID=3016789 RepID=A0ABQ5QSH6_9ACTN|nr:peptidase [Phytohabitans aurantiacus]